jgi:nitrate/nitrite transporter NarK
MAFFTIAAAGLYSCYGPMWSIPNTFLSSTVAGAAGIAMINSIGNLGGFFGPYAMGYIRDATGSFTYAILFLAACFVAGAILITTLRVGRTQAKEKAQVFEAR